MPSYPPLPPLLEPHLAAATVTAPPHSLNLVTSTLSTSATWLLLRFALAAVNRGESPRDRYQPEEKGDREGSQPWQMKVVLVSWLREEKWWRDASKKLGIPQTSLTIIDFLTGPGPGLTTPPQTPEMMDPLAHANTIITSTIQTQTQATKPGTEPNPSPIILILDGLDFLLAATGCSVREMLDVFMGWREQVHNTLIHLHADGPLLHNHRSSSNSSGFSHMETAHASLTLSIAHMAEMVMSTRALETGAARDVSGVLRISPGGSGGGGAFDDEGPEDERAERENGGEHGVVDGGEYLYFVAIDGGVRVFERGA